MKIFMVTIVKVDDEWYIKEFSYEPMQNSICEIIMIEHKHLMISADFIRRVFAYIMVRNLDDSIDRRFRNDSSYRT